MAATGENVSSGICWQRRPWSHCTSAQSVKGLYCQRPEPLDTIECINAEQTTEETLCMRRMLWIHTFCACLNACVSLEATHNIQCLCTRTVSLLRYSGWLLWIPWNIFLLIAYHNINGAQIYSRINLLKLFWYSTLIGRAETDNYCSYRRQVGGFLSEMGYS